MSLPCPGLDQTLNICFSSPFAVQSTGNSSLTGATLYWNVLPLLGADQKLLPIATREGCAILLTQAKHDSGPLGLSHKGFAMC